MLEAAEALVVVLGRVQLLVELEAVVLELLVQQILEVAVVLVILQLMEDRV
jgi:hypothetical protein